MKIVQFEQVENKRRKGDFNPKVLGCRPQRQSGHMVGGTVFGGIHGMNGLLK